jgi:tetratricopeptide (TPR) repeat protein
VEAAEGFVRVAEISGATGAPNLNNAKLAINYLDRADRMVADMLRADPDSAPVKQLLGKVAARQCQLKLYGDHDAKAALAIAVNAEARMGSAFVTGPLNEGVWRTRLCHGDALVWLNRSDEAIVILAGELARAEKARAAKPREVDILRLAYNYRLLGEAYYYKPDMPSAVKQLERAYAILSDALDREPGNVRYTGSFLNVVDTLGSAYTHTNQSADGLRVTEKGYRLALQAHDRDRADINSLERALGLSRLVANFDARLGRYGDAKALMANTEARWQALVRQSPDLASTYRLYILSMLPHGQVYRISGDLQTACTYFRRAAKEWAYFDSKWKLSPSDKTEDVAAAAQAVRACDGKGEFPKL